MRGHFTELKYRLAAAAVLCAAVLMGAVSWSFAKAPQTADSIEDLSIWAAQRAPEGTELLITVDAGRSPQGVLDSAQLSSMSKRMGTLLNRLDAPVNSFADIDPEDLQWASDKAVFMGCWPREEEPLQCALIVSVKDKALAQEFLEDDVSDIPHALRDGMVYMASSEDYLQKISGSGTKVLNASPKFQKARQRIKYGRYAFVYADLSYAAPKAAELLDEIINEDRDNENKKINLSDVRALASSLRCLVGGEDYLEQRLQGEAYLLADTAKSGQLGRIAFNPAYNIEHPALGQRAADTQVCCAANMKYNYDLLYVLLGAHPVARELRGYPDIMLSAYGLTMEKDVWGELLTGSVVCSVREFDYAGLMSKPETEEKDSAESGKKEQPAKAKAVKQMLKALANSDWRISADLRSSRKLALMAESIPLLQSLIDGKLAQDTNRGDADAAAERWKNLPPARVAGNTIWLAGKAANCGPAASQEAKLGDNTCWKTLQAMNGSRAAAVWMRNNEAILSGLTAQNDDTPRLLLTTMIDILSKRGRMQCGSMVIVPDGVRFCEVIEGGF